MNRPYLRIKAICLNFLSFLFTTIFYHVSFQKMLDFCANLGVNFDVLDFIAIQICAVLIHLHIYSCSRSLHYHVKICCTATDSNGLIEFAHLHYHVKICCTATRKRFMDMTGSLHYHVKICCTATRI